MGNSNNIRRIFKNRYNFRGRQIFYEYRLFILDMFEEGSVGAEIGVYIGGFSEYIVNRSKPKELHLIDTWPSEQLFYCFLQTYIHKLLNKGTNIVALRSSIEDAFSDKKVVENYFDWIYLDTSHDYESTVNQLEMCRIIVKKGGLLTGDDYDSKHWPGVVQAVDEFAKHYKLDCQIKNRQFIMENIK